MPSQSILVRAGARWLLGLCTAALVAALVAVPLTGAEAAPHRHSDVTLSAPRHVTAGTRVRLTGRVRPGVRGRQVLLQRRTARGWHTVRRVRTTARSRFATRLRTTHEGRLTYRAVVAATPRAKRAASPRRTVAVTWQPCGTSPLKADGTRWQCTFDDEFDAHTGDPSALDLTKWQPEVSTQNSFYTGSADSGIVCYTDDPDTLSVSGGSLHLSVVPADPPKPCGVYDAGYRGGMVHSYGRFSQTYGRFEVRARLPQTREPGLQETLWLYPGTPSYGAWPNSGEIDFAEFYSQYPDLVVPYVHYPYDASTTDAATNTNTVTAYCAIDPTAWNTYTVVWEPGTLTISRNGQTCLVDHYRSSSSSTATAPFDKPFYLLLSQAVGFASNAPTARTPFPATMDVDYVRAWR